ncbi:NAD(P)H-binding protein [Vibrio sp. SM6]|uniref:NAD(P)H-binding protein n=1 Tax=Vibrio agarilyticus TaxID=2726741 RepID=A0A7X8YH50_9VIBR|nr:NAD(P)H-binding protein [Vibrio agarilyticus]NLS13091.1 NAD(P)H-binding protein [Vibrio agarilyticus]
MTNIAITAASGQLGSAIIYALKELVSPQQLVGLSRNTAHASHLGIDIRPGDYNDGATLQHSLQNINTLVLISSNDEPQRRVTQHRNVINAAKKAGVTKLIYTSIQGNPEGNDFAPVVASNRQTEMDIKSSGLEWSIGRNGLYIEPDIEYIDHYRREGIIRNCAGNGKCGYTTRNELAWAYAKMATGQQHNGQTYNLNGAPITQSELCQYLNHAFSTTLKYENMSVDAFKIERINELGQFIGTVIAGIYQSIEQGYFNNPSDYSIAAEREHLSWTHFFEQLRQQQLQ